MFYPCYKGSEKLQKAIISQKNLNYRIGMFDSSNEAFWCTDYNENNHTSLRSPIS